MDYFQVVDTINGVSFILGSSSFFLRLLNIDFITKLNYLKIEVEHNKHSLVHTKIKELRSNHSFIFTFMLFK